MQCTNCKTEILVTAKFCPECGHKTENKYKTCPNPSCNRSGLPEEAVFCPDCGIKLSVTTNGISQNSTPGFSGSQSGFRIDGSILSEKLPVSNKVSRENSMYSDDFDSPYSISEECVACGCCIDECPVEAISEGNIYMIDADVCTECGSWADVCPVGAIS